MKSGKEIIEEFRQNTWRLFYASEKQAAMIAIIDAALLSAREAGRQEQKEADVKAVEAVGYGSLDGSLEVVAKFIKERCRQAVMNATVILPLPQRPEGEGR